MAHHGLAQTGKELQVKEHGNYAIPSYLFEYLIIQLKCQDPSHSAGTELYNSPFHSYLNDLYSNKAVFSNVKIYLDLFEEK